VLTNQRRKHKDFDEPEDEEDVYVELCCKYSWALFGKGRLGKDVAVELLVEVRQECFLDFQEATLRC